MLSPSNNPERTVVISIVSFSESMDQLVTTVSSLVSAIDEAKEKYSNYRFEMVIVNNRQNDTVKRFEWIKSDLLKGTDYDLQIFNGHGNVGYGRGHNLTIFSRNCLYFLLLNADLELESSAIKCSLDYLEKNKDVGILSPHVTNRDNERLYLCKRYPKIFDLFLRGLLPEIGNKYFYERLSHYEMRDIDQDTPTKDILLASGCFMFCRADVLFAVKAFDPRYFLYFEDFDLSLKISSIARIAYVPSVRIRHFGGNAASKSLLHIYYFVTSGIRFFQKHGWLGRRSA